MGAVDLTQSKFLKAQMHWKKKGSRYQSHHSGIALQLEKQKAYRYFERQPISSSKSTTTTHKYEAVDGSSSSTTRPLLFLTPQMVPQSTCRQLIQWAQEYASSKDGGGSSGWTTSRHYAVPTTDVPVHEVPKLLNWFVRWMDTEMLPLLQEQFPTTTTNGSQQRFYVHDAFLVRYEATRTSRFLPLHYDESTHSLILALNNHEEDFEGGGTYFYSLDRSITPTTGTVVSFRGNQLLHGGNVVTQGVRYILAVFLYLDQDSCCTMAKTRTTEKRQTSVAREIAPSSIQKSSTKRLKPSQEEGGFSFGFF
jgi:hypothetical protein